MEEAVILPSGMLDFTPQTSPLAHFPPANAVGFSPYPVTHVYLLSFQSLDLALKYCNYFFTSTFVLEAVLKLIAFGFRRFFKDRYTVFITCVGSVIVYERVFFVFTCWCVSVSLFVYSCTCPFFVIKQASFRLDIALKERMGA